MCPHCGHVDGTCYQSTAFWTSGWDLEKKVWSPDLHHHLHSSIDNISSPCFRCSTVRQQKWKVWQWDEVQTIFIAAVWLNVSWWLINSSLKCFIFLLMHFVCYKELNISVITFFIRHMRGFEIAEVLKIHKMYSLLDQKNW